MKTASTVLRETADWLELHGITKGEWGTIEDGKLCDACVMGAMRYFCGLAPEWEYATPPTRRTIPTSTTC